MWAEKGTEFLLELGGNAGNYMGLFLRALEYKQRSRWYSKGMEKIVIQEK